MTWSRKDRKTQDSEKRQTDRVRSIEEARESYQEDAENEVEVVFDD